MQSNDRAGSRVPRVESGVGLLIGGLVGFLLVELGLGDPFFMIQRATVVVSCAVAAAVLAWFGLRRFAQYVAAVLGSCYLLIACTGLVDALSASWPRANAVTVTPDAVIVLSSAVRSNAALDRDALNRTLTGLELIRRYPDARFVTSRVWGAFRGTRVSSDSDQRRLVDLVGTQNRWDVVDSTASTRDEAVGAARLLLPAGARHVVVVTSPMHTRRACAAFAAVGFAVTCRPAWEHEFVTWHPITQRDRLAAFRDYEYELLGMIKYRAKGWIPSLR